MRIFRRLGFALWLALALVAGQQAALLHDLGHASEKLSQKDTKPAPAKCDKHFAFTQLTGAASASIEIPPVECSLAEFVAPEAGSRAAPTLAYRSQAPPALL
jgi:HD superfamily phosphodiesterase